MKYIEIYLEHIFIDVDVSSSVLHRLSPVVYWLALWFRNSEVAGSNPAEDGQGCKLLGEIEPKKSTIFIFYFFPKFVDDTKLYSNVCTFDQTDHLQCDLDKKSEWSTKWQMLFNADMHRRLHVGYCHPSVNYSIGGVDI